MGDPPSGIGLTMHEPYLEFEPSVHHVSGCAGCNRVMGSYTTDAGGHLSFGPLATTLMFCPEGMDVESAFLEALGRTKGWRATAERLEILDAHGRTLAGFTAHPIEARRSSTDPVPKG